MTKITNAQINKWYAQYKPILDEFKLAYRKFKKDSEEFQKTVDIPDTDENIPKIFTKTPEGRMLGRLFFADQWRDEGFDAANIIEQDLDDMKEQFAQEGLWNNSDQQLYK